MLLAGSALACGSCASYCSTIAGTRLHTVRVILDKVMDTIVEICEFLPVVTAVAVLLVQVLVRSDPEKSSLVRCRTVDG